MPSQRGLLANRSFVYEGFTIPVSKFYAILEEVLKSRALPKMRISRVYQREGGLLGAKREYLRVRNGRKAYDICAAYFGDGCFMVSWWHRKLPARRWLWIFGFLLVVSHLDLISKDFYEAVGTFFALLLLPFLILAVLYGMAKKLPGVESLVELLGELVSTLAAAGWERLHLPTLFQSDTEAAFQAIVPATVEEVASELASGHALRSEGEELQAFPVGA